MHYLSVVSVVSGILVASVAAMNWVVDPAGIFRENTFGQRFANALIVSENGLVLPPSLDEREFKVELSRRAKDQDCVIVGSSRVMEISSARKHRSLPDCKRILNLGVSGAVIQDQITLVWLALSRHKPKLLVLGVDPWTFSLGNDERWKIRYAEIYPIARMEVDGARVDDHSISFGRWSSLINAQYAKRSIERLYSRSPHPKIKFADKTDLAAGGEFAIVLPDGSLMYSARKIAEAKSSKVPYGGGSYKTDGLINDSRAIDLFKRLILWVQDKGVKPILLMSPYHPNVLALEASPNVKAMLSTEAIVREIGYELGVPVIGSFQPNLLGCSSNEFYDFMHPMDSCFAKFTAKMKFTTQLNRYDSIQGKD